MGYETSDISFEDGVQGRYILWGFDTAFEFYPANPDNMWRLIKRCDINYVKTNVASTRQLICQIVRPPLGPTANDIWLRFFEGGITTIDPDNLNANFMQPGEHLAANDTFSVNTANTVGNGLIMPPRAQIRTQISNPSGFSVSATFFIVEADTIELLKPYL